MHLDDTMAENSVDIVKLFAKKFSSVYKSLDLSSTKIDFEFLKCFNNINFRKKTH